MKKFFAVFFGVFFAIIAGFVLLVCLFVSSNDDTSKVPVLASVPGDIVKTEDFEIVYVNGYEYFDYDKYNAPKDGYTYWCLEIEAKNISKQNENIFRSNFNCFADDRLVDSKLFSADDFITGEISPGRTTGGKIYFEVPVDAENIEVEYSRSGDIADAVFLLEFHGDVWTYGG